MIIQGFLLACLGQLVATISPAPNRERYSGYAGEDNGMTPYDQLTQAEHDEQGAFWNDVMPGEYEVYSE